MRVQWRAGPLDSQTAGLRVTEPFASVVTDPARAIPSGECPTAWTLVSWLSVFASAVPVESPRTQS